MRLTCQCQRIFTLNQYEYYGVIRGTLVPKNTKFHVQWLGVNNLIVSIGRWNKVTTFNEGKDIDRLALELIKQYYRYIGAL